MACSGLHGSLRPLVWAPGIARRGMPRPSAAGSRVGTDPGRCLARPHLGPQDASLRPILEGACPFGLGMQRPSGTPSST
eukprot:2173052-Prorocentrum_lima.AAC.1